MTHDDLASRWAARAAVARSMGDAPTADWCDEQADYHLCHSDNAERVKAAIARLEAGRG